MTPDDVRRIPWVLLEEVFLTEFDERTHVPRGDGDNAVGFTGFRFAALDGPYGCVGDLGSVPEAVNTQGYYVSSGEEEGREERADHGVPDGD
jgi:hypothetical protein